MVVKTEISDETIAKQKELSERQAALDANWNKLEAEYQGLQKIPGTEFTEIDEARGREIKRSQRAIERQDVALLKEQIEFDETVELPERLEIDAYLQAQPTIVESEVRRLCASIGYVSVEHDGWDDVTGSISLNMLHRHPSSHAARAAAENAKAQVDAVRSRISTNRDRLKQMIEQLETAKSRLLAI